MNLVQLLEIQGTLRARSKWPGFMPTGHDLRSILVPQEVCQCGKAAQFGFVLEGFLITNIALSNQRETVANNADAEQTETEEVTFKAPLAPRESACASIRPMETLHQS